MELINYDTNEIIPQRLDGAWVIGGRKEKKYDDIFMEWMSANGYDFSGLSDRYENGSKNFCWKSKFYESLINKELSDYIFTIYKEKWNKTLFPHMVYFQFTYSLFDFKNLKYYAGIYHGQRAQPAVGDCGRMTYEKYELKKTFCSLEELYKEIVEIMHIYRE